VSSIVFAFDGDRAGRAAAWRALQTVLPELREGRELHFLFLPDGEDPDSLVGREGAAGFETRLAGAQPLSEYLASQLRAQADLSHADGRAKYVSLARPLLAKIPPGVYLELLLERIAQEVGLAAERLRELLRTEAGAAPETGDVGYPPRQGTPSPRRVMSAARGGGGVGRRGLVTQAIQTLLHFPATATVMPEPLCASLEDIPEEKLGGIDTLRALLAALRARPGRTGSQLLEEWRDRPEHRRLGELQAESLLLDAAQAGAELRGILDRIASQESQERQARRYDELLAKLKSRSATPEEQLEFQLLNKKSTIRPG